MRKHLDIIFGVAVLSVMLCATAEGKGVVSCQEKGELIKLPVSAFSYHSLEEMPAQIYVARRADYFFSAKNGAPVAWARQAFVSGKTTMMCADFGRERAGIGVSMYAPALLDRTGQSGIGDSFWQFHLTLSDQKIGIWNQKTRLIGKLKSLESDFGNFAVQISWIQESYNEISLVMTRDTDKGTETLVVLYDILQRAP